MKNSRNASTAMWPGNALLVGIAMTAAWLLYGAVRYPESLSHGGPSPFLLSGAGLAAYALAAVAVRRSSAVVPFQTALRIGTLAGLCIAAVSVLHHLVEMWIAVPVSAAPVFGGGMWGLMFLAFAIACSATLLRGGSVAGGIFASVWCAMVMATALVLFAMTTNFLFMPHTQESLAPRFAESGMTDAAAFAVRHTAGAAAEHLFIAPVVAVIVAGVSAVACSLLIPLGRRTALTLGIVGLMLFAAGAASLQFASTLPRAERPPFILFGLAALAVTLASAYPLVAAARRSPQPA